LEGPIPAQEEQDMKRWMARVVVAVVTLALVAALGAAPAASSCMTQAELAVALSQLIGVGGPGISPEKAAAALSARDIQPLAGWDLEACVDDRTTAEVDQALASAIAAGSVDKQYAGSVEVALAVTAPAGAPGAPAQPGVNAGWPSSGRTYNPKVSPHTP
jgi:hypothetical protein